MGESGLVRSRVAHNTLLNFLGLAVPLALAFFVMPVAARHLGPARFGLIGLAWAITEFWSLDASSDKMAVPEDIVSRMIVRLMRTVCVSSRVRRVLTH